MKEFHRLAITNPDLLMFGNAPLPVRLANGLVIGGGDVYPELNFTLPHMEIADATMPEVRRQYEEMINDACVRALDLGLKGLVVEFELLPPLTSVAEWGAEITALLRQRLNRLQEEGVKTALRVTPNDVREFERPPRLRHGEYVDQIFRSFALCAREGADFLSIESTGGKEIHDDAILQCNLALSVFSLGILGSRDMAFLWDRIGKIGKEYGSIPAGDSACGFANTAMVLAERRYVPRVFAALVRVMSVPRSLVAFEHGAVGPNKDCAYEGPFIKAITGCPISLEGAEASCAHLSPVGNIAKACADLWSNESVQNVKLLGAMAPTVSLEQLTYATRLMNVASRSGSAGARMLRDWFVESDARLDPQAYVLRPDVVVTLAGEIIHEKTPYLRTRRAAIATLEQMRTAMQGGMLDIPESELSWLDSLSREAEALPEDEEEFLARVGEMVDKSLMRPEEYEVQI